MKKMKWLVSLLCLVLAVGCSSDDDSSENGNVPAGVLLPKTQSYMFYDVDLPEMIYTYTYNGQKNGD